MDDSECTADIYQSDQIVFVELKEMLEMFSLL